MGTWRQGPSKKDMLLGGGEEEEDDDDWEEEFNKFYTSPLDAQDELQFLEASLKDGGSGYAQLMRPDKQEELSLYLTNAPPKNP